MFGEEDLVKIHRPRIELISKLVLICFSLVIIRLWYLQIYKGQMFYRFSIENRLRDEIIKAPRGMIFSRDHQLLVNNVPRFDAVVTPQYLLNKKTTFRRLSQILSMTTEEIEKNYSKRFGQERFRPLIIKKDLTPQEVALIETENALLPGVSVRTFITREYTDNYAGAHLLGYISEISKNQIERFRKRDRYNYKLGDFIGQNGLEEQYDLMLRGHDGHEFKEVDALGRMKRVIDANNIFVGIKNRPARPGNNLRLTIDRDLQLTAFNAMEGKDGAAVAVDIHTGEILAMVSRPAFNPAKFSRGISRDYWRSLEQDTRRPLKDKNIHEHYSPGSTFKTFTLIAALEEGLVDDKTEIMCPPTFTLGRRTYHDWKKSGHGMTDAYKSLRESVDVYFYKIGTKLDIDDLARYAMDFGFAGRTGITLPREIPGLIPTKEWKKKQRRGEEWQLGETLSCVIGQSFVLVTPLQLAMAYAAIGNGGVLYRPYLVKEVFSNSGSIIKKYEKEIVREIPVSPHTLEVVRKALYQVVNRRGGTAWWYRGQGIEMAGKTGTSQVMSMNSTQLFKKCEEMDFKSRHHGLFAAFAPYYEPRIAVAVLVEHGCHGSSAAAPIARDMITTYMKKYYPEEYEQNVKKQLQVEREDAARLAAVKKDQGTEGTAQGSELNE